MTVAPRVQALIAPPPRTDPIPAEIIEAARAAATAVDAEGRFPAEALAALKAHGMLGALIPTALGGQGASLHRVAADVQALGTACSNAAMVLAMHHIQVACIVRHATGQPWQAAFLRRVADEQLLLASATSEAEIGGAMRTSRCAIMPDEGGGFGVVKQASAISYGMEADAILVTARAHEEAAAGDQVLAVVDRAGLTLERKSEWDAMGMRGTRSEAFVLTGRGLAEQIIATPFAEIAAATMVPVSHILWGGVWTGIATDAVTRARAFLRAKRKPGDPDPSSGAIRLAEAIELLQMAEARVRLSLSRLDWDNPKPPGFADAAADNGLKTSVSDACLKVVQEVMAVAGFAGYARSGPFSVTRHLRDLNSAPLMIGNSRMRESAARLLLAQKPRLGLEP